MNPLNAVDIKRSCTRFLSHHQPVSASAWLSAVAVGAGDVDFYGEGLSLAALERDIAALLGKPAALFFPSGVMAQQAGLRVVAEGAGNRSVALHPRCHIALEEERAFEQLHGLIGVPLTHEPRQPTAADLRALGPLGALVVELPLRRVAFALPTWEQLEALTQAARQAGIWVHLDGARLWECQTFYGRSAAEIATLADSVYVSLYKGLGGIAGAVICGSETFIEKVRPWRRRHGGLLRSVFPLVEAAKQGIAKHLPRMSSYVERAAVVAAAMQQIPDIETNPTMPTINAFQVHFPYSKSQMLKAHEIYAARSGAWLFDSFHDAERPGWSHADVTIGDAIEHWGWEQATEAVAEFVGSVGAVGAGRK